jgi:putative transposase
MRRQFKHRLPCPLPINRLCAIDMTGKTDAFGRVHNILGIIDHGSRRAMLLTALKDKASITLLRVLSIPLSNMASRVTCVGAI